MDADAAHAAGTDAPQRQKRSRVLLSCGPCRASKLKCDRAEPCTQCLKKDRTDLCTYAPKPEKKRQAKGVAARLRRLEGMVRDMMDGEGTIASPDLDRLKKEIEKQNEGDVSNSNAQTIKDSSGSVLRTTKTSTYIGATHYAAMLEDIEDLKDHFDYVESDSDEDIPSTCQDDTALMLLSTRLPKDRRDRKYLLDNLPEKHVMDRLVSRYFASMSPVQHIIHRPSFLRAYNKFCQDESSASFHWLAQLFMILTMGTFFNSYSNPAETQADSLLTIRQRVKRYRQCAGWALVWGKFTQPTFSTLPAFLLYNESQLALSRSGQMESYILSGVMMRLMLKMGLHRDPSGMPNITAFEGEMRRRIWNMALQLETVISFHMGLPSMIASVDPDVQVPKNYRDDDFDEDASELPPERPHSDFTSLIYPIYKTRILRVFDQIARQVHSPRPPVYADVLRLDAKLNETFATLPDYMTVRPLEDCIGDTAALIINRFGLASLYCKSRCVLHRRYLAEVVPKREHDLSRQTCLEGALALLDYQRMMWDACKPGHTLSSHGWFISALSVHDYLLAAMVIYLVIQNGDYLGKDPARSWQGKERSPTKEELKRILKGSHDIWKEVARDAQEMKKTAETLAVMLARVGSPVDSTDSSPGTAPGTTSSTGMSTSNSMSGSSWNPATDTSASTTNNFGGVSYDSGGGPTSHMIATAMGEMPVTDFGQQSMGNLDNMFGSPNEWLMDTESMDWRFMDITMTQEQSLPMMGSALDMNLGLQGWQDKLPTDNFNAMQMGDFAQWTGGQTNQQGNEYGGFKEDA